MIAISKNIGKGRVNLLCYEINNSQGNGCSMKIQEIEITDIGGIPYLKLDNLDSHMNIICGENGVGKTNILEILTNAFSLFQNEIITVRHGKSIGKISLKIDGEINKKEVLLDGVNTEVRLDRPDMMVIYDEKKSSQLLYIRTSRGFDYKKVDSISVDPVRRGRIENKDGILNKELKNWFADRSLRVGNTNTKVPEFKVSNFELAKKSVSLLDKNYSYSYTNDKNEIVIKTPTGEIFFEMLSSGFKSILFIIIGIIQEIEYRFENEQVKAEEFEGIILIDEIELHLHPEWQGKVADILKSIFKSVQFFLTTHSPHVIQSAKHSEIIALEKKESPIGNSPFEIVKRDLRDSEKYGFQGWTIEEILTDVMGMENTYGTDYLKQRSLFDEALDNNDQENARLAFNEIVQMIHPNSPIRKIMEIQMVSLG